jgi:RNA polymerase sigma factor (sigma-70 family)
MAAPDHDIRAESDEDLLVWMSWRVDQTQTAKAACTELYARHVEYLFRRLAKHREAIGEHEIEDIVIESFKKAYEKARTYQPVGGSNRDIARRNVRAWLGTIAHNLVMDQLRRPDRALRLVGEWEPLEESIRPLGDGEFTPEHRLLHEALATLSENERRVLEVTTQFMAPGEKHQRLPSGIAEDLAKSLHTTVDNIRQLRKRALDKLRMYMERARRPIKQEGVA